MSLFPDKAEKMKKQTWKEKMKNNTKMPAFRIKPVYHIMIHSSFFEGPCRWGGTPEIWSVEKELVEGKKGAELFSEQVRKYVTQEVELLETSTLVYSDDWNISEKEYEKLDKDIERVDAFIINSGHSLGQFVAVEISKRYRKPVIFICGMQSPEKTDENGFTLTDDKTVPMGIDAVSHIRNAGLEGFVALDYKELNNIISILKIIKAVRTTRVIRIIKGRFDNVDGNFIKPEAISEKHGIVFHDITISHFRKEFDRIAENPEMRQKADEISKSLIKNAEESFMSKEQMIGSVYFYLTVKKLMEEYNCNSFTANCLEICPDKRLASEIKAVPCLAHTLLRDEGYTSSCEADLNALLTVVFVMHMTQKTIHFGNVFCKNREKNIICICHDVPGLKMKGLDSESLPYKIKNFTSEGWGATIRYDFKRDIGETVNIVRFSPDGQRVLIAKGVICGSQNVCSDGCSLQAIIKIKNTDSFIHRSEDFGNHSVVVYGDYTERIKEIGRYAGFEVVEV